MKTPHPFFNSKLFLLLEEPMPNPAPSSDYLPFLKQQLRNHSSGFQFYRKPSRPLLCLAWTLPSLCVLTQYPKLLFTQVSLPHWSRGLLNSIFHVEVNLFNLLLILLFLPLNYPHISLLEFLDWQSSKWGSWFNSISIIWKFARNANSQAFLHLWNQKPWALGSSKVFLISLQVILMCPEVGGPRPYRRFPLIKLVIPQGWYLVTFHLEKKKSNWGNNKDFIRPNL